MHLKHKLPYLLLLLLFIAIIIILGQAQNLQRQHREKLVELLKKI